eukprot:7721896-Pyramimonas_sp.AAC.1
MGYEWAMHPRLLRSAGELMEAPRLRPCARLERKGSRGAGGSGKATKAKCAEGAKRTGWNTRKRPGECRNLPSQSDARNKTPRRWGS